MIMKKVKVFIVDDHKIFRDGLKLLFKNFSFVEVIGEAADGEEFLELVEKQYPDIIFMDISMPLMDGIEATEQALMKYPDMKIIVLTTFKDNDYIERMLLAGVEGYMLKNSDLSDFENAIKKVFSGGNYFSEEILAHLMRNINKLKQRETARKKRANFTSREMQMLELICQGYNNKQIGEITYLSPKTIEKYKRDLFQKTNVLNTVNLIVYAYKHQLVDF